MKRETAVSLLIVIWGIVLFFGVIWDHRRLLRAIRARSSLLPSPRRYPSVTVIRPVRGLDAQAAENIAAALDTGYPGPVETIFVFDDDSEPALPLVQQAIEAHEAAGRAGRARILIAGAPPPERTGKLNAMIAGLAQASGELLAFGDSDTRPDAQVLRRVVEKLLASPDAGAAFAPVTIVEAPRTVGDVGAALMINGLYGGAVADTVQRTGEMPFIMGQLMVLRREALSALGNLQSLSGHLVDDMQIGVKLRAAGYRNVVAPHPLPIVVRDLKLGDFVRMFRRWLIFSRSGLPVGSFKGRVWLRGFEFWAGLMVAVLAWLAGHAVPALLVTAVPLAVGWSIVRLHRELGGAAIGWHHAWVPIAILLAGPLALLSALLWPQVSWRGRSYRLDARSRLAAKRTVSDPGVGAIGAGRRRSVPVPVKPAQGGHWLSTRATGPSRLRR